MNRQIVCALAFLICRWKPSPEFQELEAKSRLNAKPDLPAREMHATLRRLVESTKDVATFAGLSHHHARFLYAALLAPIIMSDERVRPEELALYAKMVTQKLQLPKGALEATAGFIAHGLNDEEIQSTSLALRRELPMEKRIELVGMLWELAKCDADLHPHKEERVQRIAEFVGVTSVRALAEKMNVAARKAQRDDDKIVWTWGGAAWRSLEFQRRLATASAMLHKISNIITAPA